jgi:hypothetical protein
VTFLTETDPADYRENGRLIHGARIDTTDDEGDSMTVPMIDATDPYHDTHCDAWPKGITPERAIDLAHTHHGHPPAHCVVLGAAMAVLLPVVARRDSWPIPEPEPVPHGRTAAGLARRIPGATRRYQR